MVLADGKEPNGTVILPGAVMVGKAAGLTIIVLDTGANVLPQASVAVHVSVMVPPQAPAGDCVLKVEVLEVPDIKHPPDNPLL